MGQTHSDEAAHAATPEHLSSRLARRLADKCFTPLEITHFKDNFVNLADEQDGLQYWKEDTLCRFLQIPDTIGVNHVLGQMLGFLGAWPFSSLAPAILTREALVKVVAILTRRYESVLKGGRRDRAKLIFRSLAVHDRRLSQPDKPDKPELHHEGDLEAALKDAHSDTQTKAAGFSVDKPGDDEEDEDDDELALSALDSMDALDLFAAEKRKLESTEGNMRQAQIPLDNFRSLVVLMLVLAPLGSEESLSTLSQRAAEENIEHFTRIADSILWSFAPEKHAGIPNSLFKIIINNSLPYIFEGFNPLFEHFLFSKYLDLSKRRRTGSSVPQSILTQAEPVTEQSTHQPIVEKEGDILTSATLCQISFFIPSDGLFRRLRLLYSGSSDGFSINSFEQKVLNWRAPTLLLVSGTRELISSADEHPLDDPRGNFPTRRFTPGSAGNSSSDPVRVVFGAYLNPPWKHTHKEPIGDSRSILFQLEPIHDVFRASTLNQDYTALTKSGVSFGSTVPRAKPVSGFSSTLPVGPVSLNLDTNLEYGVFMHDGAGGGAYATSRARRANFEERFEVEQLEVWGCGGDDVAKEQKERWAWEEKEAMARRGVTMQDKEATYQMLEMAGLVGQGRSGGSMA